MSELKEKIVAEAKKKVQEENPENIGNDGELSDEEKREIKKEVKEIIDKQEPKDNGVGDRVSKEEKISNFFQRIELLSMSDNQKQEVAVQIKEDSKGDKLYWIEIILSAIIATLGLLQNSVAVVIGAMLIAPLLRPIDGLSFSIARGGRKVFFRSFKVLSVSIVLSIILAFFVSFFLGLNVETGEIIARTNPNAIDFFIAIFSGIVAIMSLRFSRLGESVAGVAMAASLLPPLCVVGIEIALGNYIASMGALLLFGANLFAIVFVSIIFFWLYGFTPHAAREYTKVFTRIGLTVLLILLMFIPLFMKFSEVRSTNQLVYQTQVQIEQQAKNKYKVSDVTILENKKDAIVISFTLRVKENFIAQDILQNIKKQLQSHFGVTVQLKVDIIRVVEV